MCNNSNGVPSTQAEHSKHLFFPPFQIILRAPFFMRNYNKTEVERRRKERGKVCVIILFIFLFTLQKLQNCQLKLAFVCAQALMK